MPFDLSTAKPVSSGFDLSTATPVDQPAQSQPSARGGELGLDPMGALGNLKGVADVAISTARGLVNKPAASLMGAASWLVNPTQDTYNKAQADARAAINRGEGIVQPEGLRTPEGARMAEGLGKAMSYTGLPWLANKAGQGLEAVGGPALRDFGGSVAELATLGRVPVPVKAAGTAEKLVAPTLEELKATANTAYKTARSTAGVVPQSKLGSLATKAEELLANEGATPTNEPHALGAYNAILEEATKRGVDGHSFQGLESLRRTLINSENAAKIPNDARISGQLVDKFDEWADTLTSKDMVGGVGDPQAAYTAFKQGREAWTRVKKAQTIESLIYKAENNAGSYSQSGLENSIRLQFKQLANNERRMRQFTPEERAAILAVTRTGAGQRFVRGIGKFAIRGPVAAGMDIVLGAGSPFAGMALAGVGEAGRLAATIMRENAANRVSELVRGGRPTPAVAAQPVEPLSPSARMIVSGALQNNNRNALPETP